MGMAGSPEVLPEVVLGVAGIGDEQRKDTSPADLDGGYGDQDDAGHQAGLWTHLAPFFSTTCATEEAIPRSSMFTRAAPMRLAEEFVRARLPAPLRAACQPLAPLCRGAGSFRASQRAPGSPEHRSPLLPPRSHPPLKRRDPSMLAPSPPARRPPVPRTWAALPALLCASYASFSPFSSPEVA